MFSSELLLKKLVDAYFERKFFWGNQLTWRSPRLSPLPTISGAYTRAQTSMDPFFKLLKHLHDHPLPTLP